RPAATARHGARAPEETSPPAPARDPRFIVSFPRADAPLSPALPEVALIGRSNVGKSSLLNALAGRRIAKVSGTPGKTRMLNVYVLGAGSRERGAVSPNVHVQRSEEHTSELQSRVDLVCRLLLEKKKKKEKQHMACTTDSTKETSDTCIV